MDGLWQADPWRKRLNEFLSALRFGIGGADAEKRFERLVQAGCCPDTLARRLDTYAKEIRGTKKPKRNDELDRLKKLAGDFRVLADKYENFIDQLTNRKRPLFDHEVAETLRSQADAILACAGSFRRRRRGADTLDRIRAHVYLMTGKNHHKTLAELVDVFAGEGSYVTAAALKKREQRERKSWEDW